MRFLFWAALIGLVYLAFKKIAGGSKTPPKPPENNKSVEMLSCAYCQVYFPATEAVYHSGTAYCCEEHARAKS